MHHPINFRDLGESLALLLDDPPIAIGRIFRGGKFDALASAEELGGARTILNLRRGPDPRIAPDLTYLHAPTGDSIENYNTGDRRVRRWLRSSLGLLAEPGVAWPLYVHCTSGKDRTGVFVAALLRSLGVADGVIVEEYALSEGVDRVDVERALAGLRRFELADDVSRRIAARLRGPP